MDTSISQSPSGLAQVARATPSRRRCAWHTAAQRGRPLRVVSPYIATRFEIVRNVPIHCLRPILPFPHGPNGIPKTTSNKGQALATTPEHMCPSAVRAYSNAYGEQRSPPSNGVVPDIAYAYPQHNPSPTNPAAAVSIAAAVASASVALPKSQSLQLAYGLVAAVRQIQRSINGWIQAFLDWLTWVLQLLQYRLMLLLRLPTWGKLGALLLAGLPVVGLGSWALRQVSEVSWHEAVQYCFYVLNNVPGTDVTRLPSLGGRLLLVGVHLGSLCGFAGLVGLVAEDVRDAVEGVRSGNFPLPARGHTVVLHPGGDPQRLRSLVEQIAAIRQSRGNSGHSGEGVAGSGQGRRVFPGCIAVLSTQPKADLDALLASALPPRLAGLVVTRQGDPTKLTDLQRVAAAAAHTVLLLAPDGPTGHSIHNLPLSPELQQQLCLAALRTLHCSKGEIISNDGVAATNGDAFWWQWWRRGQPGQQQGQQQSHQQRRWRQRVVIEHSCTTSVATGVRAAEACEDSRNRVGYYNGTECSMGVAGGEVWDGNDFGYMEDDTLEVTHVANIRNACSRVAVQCALQPGLAAVFEAIFCGGSSSSSSFGRSMGDNRSSSWNSGSYGGVAASFHVVAVPPHLSGRTFGEARRLFPRAALCGVMGASQHPGTAAAAAAGAGPPQPPTPIVDQSYPPAPAPGVGGLQLCPPDCLQLLPGHSLVLLGPAGAAGRDCCVAAAAVEAEAEAAAAAAGTAGRDGCVAAAAEAPAGTAPGSEPAETSAAVQECPVSRTVSAGNRTTAAADAAAAAATTATTGACTDASGQQNCTAAAPRCHDSHHPSHQQSHHRPTGRSPASREVVVCCLDSRLGGAMRGALREFLGADSSRVTLVTPEPCVDLLPAYHPAGSAPDGDNSGGDSYGSGSGNGSSGSSGGPRFRNLVGNPLELPTAPMVSPRSRLAQACHENGVGSGKGGAGGGGGGGGEGDAAGSGGAASADAVILTGVDSLPADQADAVAVATALTLQRLLAAAAAEAVAMTSASVAAPGAGDVDGGADVTVPPSPPLPPHPPPLTFVCSLHDPQHRAVLQQIAATANATATAAAAAVAAARGGGGGGGGGSACRGLRVEVVEPSALISGMLAQVGSDPRLAPCLADLLDEQGCELYVKSPEEYGLAPYSHVSWGQVCEAVRGPCGTGDVALGLFTPSSAAAATWPSKLTGEAAAGGPEAAAAAAAAAAVAGDEWRLLGSGRGQGQRGGMRMMHFAPVGAAGVVVGGAAAGVAIAAPSCLRLAPPADMQLMLGPGTQLVVLSEGEGQRHSHHRR